MLGLNRARPAPNGRRPGLTDRLVSLADPTRNRLLLLLDRRELRVSELREIVRLPQSTVSRHLKALVDGGWIGARTEGTSHLYAMTHDELEPDARRLWRLVREEAGSSAAARQDARRLQTTLARRRTTSQEFFSTAAGQWDKKRAELFGERFHLASLAGLANPRWVVGISAAAPD